MKYRIQINMWQSIVINFTYQGFPEHSLLGKVKYYVLRERIVLKSDVQFQFYILLGMYLLHGAEFLL